MSRRRFAKPPWVQAQPNKARRALEAVDQAEKVGVVGARLKGFLIADALLFVLGWILVFVSGYGGNSRGSELVWRIRGITVYVAVPVLILGFLLYATSLLSV